MKYKTPYIDLLPPLSSEEYTALEADIRANGVIIPIVIDDDGNILDGHHRYKIEPNAPYTVLSGLSVEEKMAYVLSSNMKRRNLSPEQKSEVRSKMQAVAISLNKQGKTQEQIGTILGVARQTIGDWLNITNAGNGISYKPVNNKIVIPKEEDDTILQRLEDGETQEQLAADYGVTQPAISKRAEQARDRKKKKEEREELIRQADSLEPDDRWNIYQADMETWQAAKRYDFIITDPPYPKEYLNLYDVLGKRAKDWLKDGGMLVAMCGQSYINEVYQMLDRHLDYYWTAAYLTPGQPTPLRQRNVNTTWKPLLIYTKGEYTGKIFGDVFKSDGNDKSYHKWGQSASGMMSIISQICLQGQSVLDPFCGAGTTGIAALSHGCLFDGIELEEDNCKLSISRLRDMK